MNEQKSVFETLSVINVNDKVEKKNNLSYLSWAFAWGEVKKIYPNANYVIYERETDYGLVNYFTDGKTCWVKTGVIINDLEHIEDLPVMDFRNKSISLDNVTSFDVNKSIQRSLTKALARHGLGLYIYAGEDLPNDEKEEDKKPQKRMSKREKEEVRYVKLRNELTKLNINYRDGETTVKYILDTANVTTQDNSALNDDEIKRLNDIYQEVISKKGGIDISSQMETF